MMGERGRRKSLDRNYRKSGGHASPARERGGLSSSRSALEYSGYRRPTQYSPRQQPNLAYARRICCAKQDQTLTGREPAAFSSSFRLCCLEFPNHPNPVTPAHHASATPCSSKGACVAPLGARKHPLPLLVCGRLSSSVVPSSEEPAGPQCPALHTAREF